MKILQHETAHGTIKCGACQNGNVELFPFSMAFQPIVDTAAQTVFAYEALVRGPHQESAYYALSQLTPENRYLFDQTCRVKAIELAAKLGVGNHGERLSVNFMPGAVYSPKGCIQRTLLAAETSGFPLEALIFEITEDEKVRDSAHLQEIVTEYKKHGFAIALDDFGAGYSGLNHLADLNVDLIKLDAKLVRDVHKRPRAETVVRRTVDMCGQLGVKVVGEAVETVGEHEALRDCGIDLMQGYLFAKPQFEALPAIAWPGNVRRQPSGVRADDSAER